MLLSEWERERERRGDTEYFRDTQRQILTQQCRAETITGTISGSSLPLIGSIIILLTSFTSICILIRTVNWEPHLVLSCMRVCVFVCVCVIDASIILFMESNYAHHLFFCQHFTLMSLMATLFIVLFFIKILYVLIAAVFFKSMMSEYNVNLISSDFAEVKSSIRTRSSWMKKTNVTWNWICLII